MLRIIPRKLLQILAMLLLPLSVLLAGYWFAVDQGVYHLFVTALGRSPASQGLSLMLTVLVNLIGVAVIVAILRIFTRDMPPLRAHFQIKSSPEMRLEGAGRPDDTHTTEMQGRVVAVALMTIGLAVVLVGLASLLMVEGFIYGFQVILLLAGLGMIVGGCVMFVRGR